MKKLFIILMLMFPLYMETNAETVVYVGGSITDGIDKEPAYWKNGVLHNVFKNAGSFLNNRTYGGMAIENGNVYMCFKDGYSCSVYKFDTCLFYINLHSKSDDVSSIAVLNGKVYVGIRQWDQYYRDRYYYLVKNGDNNNRIKNAGKYIIAEDGILYYSLQREEGQNGEPSCECIRGYVARGTYFDIKTPLSSTEKVYGMEVINGEVYFSTSYGCIFNNNNKVIPNFKLYGIYRYISQYAIAGGKSYLFYHIDNSNFVSSFDGINILGATQFKPIRIVGKGEKLYILASKQRGAILEYAYLIYNPSTSTIETIKTLPSACNAYDLHVVEE